MFLGRGSSQFTSPIPVLTIAAGAAITGGLGHLILKASENMNDDNMARGMANRIGIREENSPAANYSTIYFI